MVFGKLKLYFGKKNYGVINTKFSYVAAKTVYFGVGGGILPFCNLLRNSKDESGDKMKYEKVFESSSTVKREILKVSWDC
jgi:hypothetical protein